MNHSRDFLFESSSNSLSYEYGPSPNSQQPQRFALITNNNRIVPQSAVIDLDNQRQLAAMTIIIEKSQAKASIVSVRNWQHQKSRSIFYVNFDQNLIPKAEFLFDMRTSREADKSPVDGSYLTFPLHPIYIQEYPQRINVTNLVGEAYIFIHNSDSNKIRVYHHKSRGSGGDQIDAQVLFTDADTKRTTVMPVFNPETLAASHFVLLNSRDEFGNGQESYATTSWDVRQVIISQAEPEVARRLCQLDNRHRKLCKEKLTTKQKSRICLSSTDAAQECDLIPMFSRQQFLALIPPNIEIYAEDAVHNTYEFYPQGYKLPTEGFAVALRKAKLMNTICAIVRPNFLLAPSALQLQMPAYLDAKLLDDVRKAYMIAVTYVYVEERDVSMGISLFDADLNEHVDIQIKYYHLSEPAPEKQATLQLDNISSEAKSSFWMAARNDNFLKPMTDFITADMDDPTDIFNFWSILVPNEPDINRFRLSRLIKIAFDMGYYHQCRLVMWAGPEFTTDVLL